MAEDFRLISYCIPTDDGAAPNPFHGVCSLVICKPVIRRVTARIGDWVVGTGSKDVNGKNYSGHLVYAMQVTDKMPMAIYDASYPEKRPDLSSNDPKKWVGDSIYDYSLPDAPIQRPGVHSKGNEPTDLRGENALLSTHFYYFGDAAVPIPPQFSNIVRQTQGHQYNPNEQDKVAFIDWLESTFSGKQNTLIGMPQQWPYTKDEACGSCRIVEDIEDEERAKEKLDDGC